MKTCSVCKEHLPVEAFGNKARCRSCAAEDCRVWRSNNREKVKVGKRAWRRANPERAQVSVDKWHLKNPNSRNVTQQKRRAAKRKAPGSGFTLSEWEIVLAEFANRCAYCDAEGKMTMDHVLPLALGGAHDASNIVPACLVCNCSKNDTYLPIWLGVLDAEQVYSEKQ